MLISNKDYFVFFHIFGLYKTYYAKSNNIHRDKGQRLSIRVQSLLPSLPLCKWRYHQRS